MSPWLLAVVAGIAITLLQYGWRLARQRPLGVIASLLRLLAATLAMALLLDAPAGQPAPVRTWAALDVSQSMMRGDSALWRAALDSLRGVHADSVLAFGDSVRRADAAPAPQDAKSELRALADRAVAAGHPVALITDGEVADRDAIASLPAGSRVIMLDRAAVPDLAVASLDIPRAIVVGDSVLAQVTLVAGSAAAPAGKLVLRVDDHDVAVASTDPLPAFGSRRVEMRFVIAGAPGPAIVRAVVQAGDRVAANDTLSVAVDRSRSASAVFVSTSPDLDSRAALGLLRGALALPARGFLQVAPGQWRVDGPLTPISQADVKAALRDAPIAIIHGDTAVFGAPRSATVAPLALIVPTTDTTAEWYVASIPPSPLTPALSGIPWDSLPPLLTGGDAPKGAWTAMDASPGRTGAPRALVAGVDSPRRVVTIAAGGFWRWQFRGGTSADAFAAFWGGIFDWLAGERADRRPAIPDAAFFRAGDPIRWRRGSAADSAVRLVLRRRNATTGNDSLMLRFAPGASVTESGALAPGIYDVSMREGSAIVAVNASSEWIPRAPNVAGGAIRGGSPVGAPPRLRDWLWTYALVIGALCAEWLLRRRLGLR